MKNPARGAALKCISAYTFAGHGARPRFFVSVRDKRIVTPAILALADGTHFIGQGFGAEGLTAGEVVFNTALTGYQEILSDPSYAQQLVTLTYPHIGNVGCNAQDMESAAFHAAGLIVRQRPRTPSNFRAESSLHDAMVAHGRGGISGIDTRKLTRILRNGGAQAGALLVGDGSVEQALEAARGFAGLQGMNLADEVSCHSPYDWSEGRWNRDPQAARCKVVVYDFGVKFNILRCLVDAGCTVRVVPSKTPLDEAIAQGADGVLLSNGPGDPEPVAHGIAVAKELLERGLPTMGICLGHQILALAAGAQTSKMKFGHHGANHPVQDLATGRVAITSQNHGFAVDEASLPANLRPTHRSLFDGTLQGVKHTDAPAFSFQGHPEASPGPHDLAPLFAQFVALMRP